MDLATILRDPALLALVNHVGRGSYVDAGHAPAGLPAGDAPADRRGVLAQRIMPAPVYTGPQA